MKYVGIGIGAAIIAACIFLFVQQKGKIESLETTIQDTTAALSTKFKFELSECYSKLAAKETVRVQIPTVFRKLSPKDSARIASFIEFANQGKLDSLFSVIAHLSAPKWGHADFKYEGENLNVTGYAYADIYPLDGDTVNVVATVTDVQILNLPRDTVIVNIAKDYTKPFIGKVQLSTNWDWIIKNKRSEFGIDVGLPINVGAVTVIPKAGHHSMLKTNVGARIVVEF